MMPHECSDLFAIGERRRASENLPRPHRPATNGPATKSPVGFDASAGGLATSCSARP
jgi:hypothetical protein